MNRGVDFLGEKRKINWQLHNRQFVTKLKQAYKTGCHYEKWPRINFHARDRQNIINDKFAKSL